MTPKVEGMCIGEGSFVELQNKARQIALKWGGRYDLLVVPTGFGQAALFLSHAEGQSYSPSTSAKEAPHVHLVFDGMHSYRGEI